MTLFVAFIIWRFRLRIVSCIFYRNSFEVHFMYILSQILCFQVMFNMKFGDKGKPHLKVELKYAPAICDKNDCRHFSATSSAPVAENKEISSQVWPHPVTFHSHSSHHRSPLFVNFSYHPHTVLSPLTSFHFFTSPLALGGAIPRSGLHHDRHATDEHQQDSCRGDDCDQHSRRHRQKDPNTPPW